MSLQLLKIVKVKCDLFKMEEVFFPSKIYLLSLKFCSNLIFVPQIWKVAL